MQLLAVNRITHTHTLSTNQLVHSTHEHTLPPNQVPSASAAAARAGVVPMALLKEGVDISLTADSFWVHHDAQVGGCGAVVCM